MSNESRNDDVLREALAPGKDCLSIEDLGHYLEEKGDATWRSGVKSHLFTCAHCRTELHLLQEFQAGDIGDQEAPAVQAITAQLSGRSSEIFGWGGEPAAARPSWWKGLFTAPWLSPAVVALAGILLIAGVGMEIRKSAAPSLHPVSGSGEEVLRSSALTVVAPVGDLSEAPKEVQWQPVAGAAKYQVRLLEVDRSLLWQAATADTRVALPDAVRDRIVPGKTILSEVVALDAAGAKIAGSEILRFRVAPNIH